jgi:hypothetical protein
MHSEVKKAPRVLHGIRILIDFSPEKGIAEV